MARAGFILFFVAAAGDAYLTYIGLAGSVELEGNPVMKSAMEQAGILPALVLIKTIVGLALWFLAERGGRAIHQAEEWIWSLPMLPPVRVWLKAGDRCWIALLPLYGVAFAQLVAALMWASL
jgi:hypothetical protein